MSGVKKGKILTVSTENGISRSTTGELGVLEISGPGVTSIQSQYSTISSNDTTKPQLVIGATDVSGIFQIGVTQNQDSFLAATCNNGNKNLFIQKYGGKVGVGMDSIDTAPLSSFHIGSKDALIIPVGSTADRPGQPTIVPNASGMIRYNSDTTKFEAYADDWGSLVISDLSENVGIGTPASSTYKLNVDGSANFTGDVSMNDVSMNGGLSVVGDVSLNTLKVHGDLSANDASFNVIDATSIGIVGDQGFKFNSSSQNVNTYLKIQAHANTTTSDKEFILPSLNVGSNSDTLCGLSTTQTLTNKTISISQITNLQNEIDAKQDTLTAGTNITINGSTISASGGSSSVWSSSNSDISYTGGDVGIGTSSPKYPLHIKKSSAGGYYMMLGQDEFGANTTRLIGFGHIPNNSSSSYYPPAYMGYQSYNGTSGSTKGHLIFGTRNTTSGTTEASERMRITDAGNVGIATTSPGYPLHVNGFGHYEYGGVTWKGYSSTDTSWKWTHYGSTNSITIRAQWGVWCTNIFLTSDERIKENIVDVSDNLALQMVRDIPCRYYEYKDKFSRGTDKTIGFIAQEVADVLPMAVSIQKDIIPNEMRKLENVSWEQIDNTYKLITDLQDDVSGVKYRFYVSNDVSGNNVIKKEIIGNSDNTFTFDSSYNQVFIYGKEVDDFHILDKQKLFTLNFSATQEIDRIQQQHIIEIESHKQLIEQQQSEIENLKLANQDITNELNTIKTHLGLQ